MRLPALSLVLLLAAAPAVHAQDCLEQIKFPGVGRWAEYKALYNGKDPYTVRYAVIGGNIVLLDSGDQVQDVFSLTLHF